MLGFGRGVGIVAVLFAALAWSVSAAEDEPSSGEPQGTKIKLKAAEAPADETAPAGEADPFVVPDGTPKELVEYVTNLISKPPRDADTRKKMRQSILQALDKVLADKPTDEELDFAVEVKMNMLEDIGQLTDFAAELKTAGRERSERQVRSFILQIELTQAAKDPKSARETIEKAVKFLEEAPPQPADIRLAFLIGRLSEMVDDKEFAVNTYTALAKVFAGSQDEMTANAASLLEGVVRRLNLVGQEVKIEGKLLDGEAFDWSTYKDKVVLVDFWASGYPTSVRAVPGLKKLYEKYHAKGLDIVGISLDRDAAAAEEFVKEKDIPWPSLVGDGKPSPVVFYYGVMSLPTTFVVGKDGKVLAVNPTAEELQKTLDDTFGPVEDKPADEKAADEKPADEAGEN